MPYIDYSERAYVNSIHEAVTTGQLNYQFTMLIRNHLRLHGLKYCTINDVIGALEAAKLEFYRRVVVPYEDKKIAENGDVYDTN